MAYEKERAAALQAVAEACALCESVRENLVNEETLTKKDRSPVTVADFGAQALVLDCLQQAFPDDPVVGEEDSAELRAPENEMLLGNVVKQVRYKRPDWAEAGILAAIDRGGHEGGDQGRFWTLDPIDGTKGFLRNEQYAVALALIEEGQVVLGVLGCPRLPQDPSTPDGARGCLFVGVRGQGAFQIQLGEETEQPIHVSGTRELSQAAFCESVESGHTLHDHSARIAERLGVQAEPVRMDSQCKYAALARGEASIYLRLPTRPGYEEKIWDHAAGWMVMSEAGGRVTDTAGKDLDFSLGRTLKANRGVVGTNGPIHDAVIEAVQDVLNEGA